MGRYLPHPSVAEFHTAICSGCRAQFPLLGEPGHTTTFYRFPTCDQCPPISYPQFHWPPCWHAVYWLYDVTGTLLYVGHTKGSTVRWEMHTYKSAWWPEVRRRDVRWYGKQAEALTVEREAIRVEDPLHNVQGKPLRQPATRPAAACRHLPASRHP